MGKKKKTAEKKIGKKNNTTFTAKRTKGKRGAPPGTIGSGIKGSPRVKNCARTLNKPQIPNAHSCCKKVKKKKTLGVRFITGEKKKKNDLAKGGGGCPKGK